MGVGTALKLQKKSNAIKKWAAENPETANALWTAALIRQSKKKKSGLSGALKTAVGIVAPVAGLATAAAVKPKATISTAIHTAGEVIGNLGQSSINVIKETARGNISGALQNAANVATLGTIDTTGGNKGILNINTSKYLYPQSERASTSTSSALSSYTTGSKKAKGLLTQLRKGKGSAGGGSYTEAVKNPLGGSAGKTGK